MPGLGGASSLGTTEAPGDEQGLQEQQESLYGDGRCFAPASEEGRCGRGARRRIRSHGRWAGVGTQARGNGSGTKPAPHWGGTDLPEKRLANVSLEWCPTSGHGSHFRPLEIPFVLFIFNNSVNKIGQEGWI